MITNGNHKNKNIYEPGIIGPKKGNPMAKKKIEKIANEHWFPLKKSKGEWQKENAIKEPLKRNPCLYDVGTELMLRINGYTVLQKLIRCPGDRVQFLSQMNHACDSFLLA